MLLRLILAGLVLLNGLLFTSCRQSSAHQGYKKTDSGLYYKFIRESNSGVKAAKGLVIFCHMAVSLEKGDEDSLLFDSKNFPHLPGDIRLIQISDPLFQGDIMEGLVMLQKGDSASFIVNADSFFLKVNQLNQLPEGIKPGSELVFEIGVVDVKTEEEARRAIDLASTGRQKEEIEAMKALQEEEPIALERYLVSKNIKEKPNPSGLIYVPTLVGKGPKPRSGQKVTVHYAGYLLNGRKFDSSYDRDQPFVFTLGEGQVIEGWDEGIAMMNVGGSATLIIPSNLAYGSNGQGMIPPFSPLVFDVQLMNAE